MHRYLLPTHVYWCIAEHCAVFLDLKRDKYFGLTPEQSVRLQGLTESGSVSDEHVADLCRELLECGLLTSEQSGKELRATSLSRADAALLDPDEDTLSPTLEWHHLVNLLYAVVSAWLALRICPLGWTIRKLQHRERVANGDRKSVV